MCASKCEERVDAEGSSSTSNTIEAKDFPYSRFAHARIVDVLPVP